MRSPRRRVVAVIAALTVLITVSGPAGRASAATVPWAMAPCATAELSETELDSNRDWLLVFGAAVQCAPAVSGGGIRLAVYPAGGSTGTAAGYNVRLFPSTAPGAIRTFGAAIARPGAGEYGVCVLAGDDVRIACARVTVARGASTVTVPLDPSDPLVVKPVRAQPYTGSVYPPADGDPGGGVCGSCF